MDWNEITKAIDTEVFDKTQRHLKEVENIVLHGAWQGRTYGQIEESCDYSLSYLKQAAGPRLWKLLSKVFEENISKTNFRVVIEKWLADLNQPELLSDSQTRSKLDLGKMPKIAALYGRDRELELLQQWIVEDRCRSIAIFGMAGIGKTALAIRYAEQNQTHFDSVIWRSLHYVPGAAELVGELLHCFTKTKETNAQNLDVNISALIEYLSQNRCLIILDTAAEIWQSGDLAGHYLQEYKGYGELLRRLGTEVHQSCLLLCTREKPREIALLEGDNVSVRSFRLNGLSSQAQYIFREKQLLDSDRWEELIQLYRGNPLALKIVVTTIAELFGGSVSAFLKQDTIVYGDIYDLLDEQFERLSVSEQEIINWLAIACSPLSFIQLQSNIILPLNTAELIEALESLLRRSLIVKTKTNEETLFSLYQPVVTQYAIDRTVGRVCQEIIEINETLDLNRLEFIRNYILVTSDLEIRQLQIRQIIIPIKNRLYKTFRDESAIETCLQAILLLLKDKTPLAIGYTKQNVEILLELFDAV